MRLLRVARNVSSLERLGAFYAALGFRPMGAARADPALAARLGAQQVQCLQLSSGMEWLELTACTPQGAPYPDAAGANASLFQHIALLVKDAAQAARLAVAAGATPLSAGGPVRLPAAAGGVVAWKFRDPDGHPLEFIQAGHDGGYDHSAIVTRDAEAASGFYERLGLRRQHEQRNEGPEQARLDGFAGAAARIVSLRGRAGPGVELLGYDQVIPLPAPAPRDLAADRLVFAGPTASLLRDPDGHFLQIEQTGEMRPR